MVIDSAKRTVSSDVMLQLTSVFCDTLNYNCALVFGDSVFCVTLARLYIHLSDKSLNRTGFI